MGWWAPSCLTFQGALQKGIYRINTHYIRCIWGWLLRIPSQRVPPFSLWFKGKCRPITIPWRICAGVTSAAIAVQCFKWPQDLTLWGKGCVHLTWAMKKKPWLFRVYRGWNTTQLCRDYDKPLQRIPMKQPGFNGMSYERFFFAPHLDGISFWANSSHQIAGNRIREPPPQQNAPNTNAQKRLSTFVHLSNSTFFGEFPPQKMAPIKQFRFLGITKLGMSPDSWDLKLDTW